MRPQIVLQEVLLSVQNMYVQGRVAVFELQHSAHTEVYPTHRLLLLL